MADRKALIDKVDCFIFDCDGEGSLVETLWTRQGAAAAPQLFALVPTPSTLALNPAPGRRQV